MRRPLALAAFGLLLLPAMAPVAPAPAPTIPWDLRDCFFAFAGVPVERNRLQPFLPEGFVAAGPATLPDLLHPASQGASLMGFELNVCREGAGLNGPVQGMTYASIWVLVDPPDDLEVPGVDAYFVNWDVLIPDADRRAVLQGAGLPAHDGAITLGPPDLAVADANRFELTLDGLGTITYRASPSRPNTPFIGNFMQFQPNDHGGYARWFTEYASTNTRQAAGVLELPEGSWVRDLIGPATPATVNFGTWDYTDGFIEPGFR